MRISLLFVAGLALVAGYLSEKLEKCLGGCGLVVELIDQSVRPEDTPPCMRSM